MYAATLRVQPPFEVRVDCPHPLASPPLLLMTQSIDSCRCHVLPSYGMTECMPIAAPPEGYELDRVGSSGLPLGPTVQVQDAEGHALPANTHGHIVVRGRPCFGGYLPPATGQLAGQPTKPQEANTGASGKKDGGGGGQVVLVVTSFCCLNLSLSLFNKWALGDDGAAFRFPTFYTMWHMIASVLGSLTIMAASPQQRTLSCAQVRTYWWQLASLAVFFVGSLVFNAASLVYIGLSVNQILRACSPLPQLLFSYGIEGKVPSVRLCLIVLTLCTFGALSIPIGALTATSFGLTFALAGVLLLAAKVSTSSVLMKDAKKSGLTPVALVFYDSSLSFIGCLAMWLLNRDERDASLEYLRADPQRAALVIVTGSTMAMLYNVVSFTLTKRTSSVTSSILGATLKITLIAVSAVMEGGHSVANWIATILFFVVLLSYVYDRMGNWRAGKEAYVESAGDSAHNSLMNSVRTDTDGAWFDTGDEGHLDSDGYLYITGRTKEMINRGGETIAPGQIEEALASHPAVAEVAAFSTPHTTLSEAVGVCVVLQPGSARVSLRELTGHCASLLAPSRWPWLVVYAPSLPRTRGRKVVRRGLAERMALPLLGDEDPEAERTFEVLSDAEMSGSTPIPTRRVEALPTNPAGDDSPSETDLDGPTVEWTPAERSVLSAWRQLRMSGGVPAAEAGAGLDDDLRLAGGTSIQLGLLASTLSQQHGVTIRPIALFSPPRSVRSIAAALEKMSSTQHSTCERAAGRSDTSGGAMGNTTTNNGDDSAPGRASAQMSCLALVVQGLPYALFESTYQITGLMLRSFVLVASPISLHGKHYYGASSPLLTTLRVALALVASRRLLLDIVLPLLGVAIKWTVLGRLREGRYPLWGGVYLRWWFADRALKWCGKGALFTMNGVWHRTYLRMLGATIGNGAALSPDAILTEPDLLAFGKDAAVDAGAIISPFVADNGAMVAKRITIGEGCTICANATVAPGASLLPGAVLPVLSSSHDQPPSEAERCEFQKLCRSRFTLPARWRRWLIGNPTLLLVQIVAYIPQLFVLHWLVIPSKQHHASHDAYASNFHVEPDAPFGVRFGSRLAWLALPERQLALLVSAAVAHVFGPIFHFAAAVVVKRVLIGKFSEGPRTEWARFQFWLMNEMVDKQLCGVHALFGFYWGATTLAMKALGAHVGKRIFWPHTMPKIVEFDLLTVGDDVTFGSRSTIFASDNQRLAHVTLGAGSMISDRCCLLPGSSVGRNGVLGSGTLAEQDRHYGADCLTIGAADGRCIVLNEGSTSTPPVPRIPEAGDVDTFSPFARTFHGSNVVMPGREPRPSQTATYWVPPRAMIALFAAAVSPLEPMLRSSNMLAVLLMLRWLDGFSEGNLVMNPHARMAFVATVFGFLTFYRVSVLPLYTAILVAVSRARDSFDNPDHANLDWDQSTYLLRRKMIEYLPTGKGELEKLGGSAYIVGYYRLLNAKIGRDVCLFPAGCHDGLLPTEPAQVEIGDRVCVNRSSLVGHLNTRGHFVIGRLNLGSRSTLRDFTRVMGGSVLAPRSRLLEHTLLMAGESSTRGETLQGWPTRDSLPDSHVHDAEEEEACVGEEKASDEFAFGLLGGTAQPDEYKDKASEREHSNVRVLKWRTCILLGLLVPSLVIGVAMAQLVSTSLAHNLAQHAEPGPVAAEPGPVAQQAEPGPPSAQLLLHVPSRADHAFLVATVETRSDARSFPMDGAHGIDFLNVNPPGKSWDGFQAKTEGYVAWLDSEIERSGGEQIALVADADDVMYGGCGHAEIMQRYRAIVERSGGARVVFGAQFRVYPSYAQRYVASYYHSPAILARKAAVQQLVGTDDSSYAPWLNETECALDFDGHAQKHIDRWDSCPQPHAYACLNSGLVMGPLSDLRAVFHGMLSMPSKSSHAYDRGQIRYTDQMAAHSYAAEHASNVTLDYTGSLFGDLVHMNAPSTAPTAMYYVEGRGREATVHNAVTNTTQCFLHGNGNERIKAMWARVNSEMGASCQPRFEGDKRCSGSELAPM